MSALNSYPFEKGPIDFKIKPPTSLQKRWMASQIRLGKEDPRSMAKKFGCKISYIRNIISKVNRNKRTQQNVGRPKLFDEISMNYIHNLQLKKLIGLTKILLNYLLKNIKRVICVD